MFFVRALAILPEACNRTRQHVSLRLDRQLSELEVAVMENHLARCPACRSFANELEGVTEALREAELVEPPIHFEVPRRPARVGVSRAGAVAAAAILVAVALGGVSGLGPHAPATGSVANLQGARERARSRSTFARSRRLDRRTVRHATGCCGGADGRGAQPTRS